MATKRAPAPYRLTVTLSIPKARLDEVKRVAKAHGVTLEELVESTVVHGALTPAPDRVIAKVKRAGACEHTRKRGDSKIPGIFECIDCGARPV